MSYRVTRGEGRLEGSGDQRLIASIPKGTIAQVALTLAGAVMVFVNPAIAFPFIAIGMALVAVEQTDKRRGRFEDR